MESEEIVTFSFWVSLKFGVGIALGWWLVENVIDFLKAIFRGVMGAKTRKQ
jgi:hypothetical protein